MTIILDMSIFQKLNRRTFRGIFNKNDVVILNGREFIITSKKATCACFKIGLRNGDITFEIQFKFKSDSAGSLSSINMMFSENTKISDEMTIIRHLGSGSFGDVFLVSVACKNYALKVGIDIPCGSGRISAIQNEINIFGHLGQNPQHPNLIQSFPIDFPLGPALLLEFGQETLDDKIKSGTLTFQQTMEIIRQIWNAIAFLHSIGISHNDLKPNNVIFVDGVPKLIDFGLSYRWETETSFRTYRNGTPGYKHENPTTNYAQDALSCCFIFIEMLIGKKIRSYNSKTLGGITELSDSDIENELKAKQVSEENIQKIFRIYRMKNIIDLPCLIHLAKSIQ